jgi:hypothetical protein
MIEISRKNILVEDPPASHSAPQVASRGILRENCVKMIEISRKNILVEDPPASHSAPQVASRGIFAQKL